jgi:hypothetical protein
MKQQIYKICTQLNDGQIAVTEATEQLLDLFAVSGSFSQKDMENFAAKCMILGHRGKTTKELLQDFCDNDL